MGKCFHGSALRKLPSSLAIFLSLDGIWKIFAELAGSLSGECHSLCFYPPQLRQLKFIPSHSSLCVLYSSKAVEGGGFPVFAGWPLGRLEGDSGSDWSMDSGVPQPGRRQHHHLLAVIPWGT